MASPNDTERTRSRRYYAAAAAVLLLVAATWYGAFDTPFNPRHPDNAEDARTFIRTTVNAAANVVVWKAGDTVTLCGDGNSCAIFQYFPGTALWAKARDIDSRSRPPESWLQRLRNWLAGTGPDPGSLYDIWVTADGNAGGTFGQCIQASNVMASYYVDGHWNHGYVNGHYSGSAFVGNAIYTLDNMAPEVTCGWF